MWTGLVGKLRKQVSSLFSLLSVRCLVLRRIPIFYFHKKKNIKFKNVRSNYNVKLKSVESGFNMRPNNNI
jgi:hypothetical protein